MSRLATPPFAIQSDMSQVIDDATSAMNDGSTLLDETVPLGEFLDEQLAKAKELETDENYDSPIILALLLELKCLRYLMVMSWTGSYLEKFLLVTIERMLRNY